MGIGIELGLGWSRGCSNKGPGKTMPLTIQTTCCDPQIQTVQTWEVSNAC